MKKNKETSIVIGGEKINLLDIEKLNKQERLAILALRGNAIQYIKHPSSEESEVAISQNAYAIRYIKDPNEELQRAAIKQQPTSIQFVENPNQDILMEAFRKDPNVYPFIPNPTYEMMVNAVSRKGATIQYIENPDIGLINIAIKQNPMALGHIKDPSNNIVKEVIRSKPKAVKNIINKLPYSLQLYAITKKGQLIKYVKKPSLEMMKIAIEQEPDLVKHLKDIPVEVQRIAIEKNSKVLKYLYNVDEEIQSIAINNDPNVVKYIENPSSKILDLYNSSKLIHDKRARRAFVKNDISPRAILELERKYSQLCLLEQDITKIVDNTEPIYTIINTIIRCIEPIKICIAVGFLYKSGLNLLANMLKVAQNRNIRIRLVIGSLQDYTQNLHSGRIMNNIDLETVRYLNGLINMGIIELRTLNRTFFHGKYYYSEGDNKIFSIIGSSNISYSGLVMNRELNVLSLNQKQHNNYDYQQWFEEFWNECEPIQHLEENLFKHNVVEKDHHSEKSDIHIIETKKIYERIKSLSDDEIKKRFKLWMSKSPDNFYEQNRCIYLKDYYVIQYTKYSLIILESFEANNAYFCFRAKDVNVFLDEICNLTKVQLCKNKCFIKRGYHISDDFRFEVNINSIFIENTFSL